MGCPSVVLMPCPKIQPRKVCALALARCQEGVAPTLDGVILLMTTAVTRAEGRARADVANALIILQNGVDQARFRLHRRHHSLTTQNAVGKASGS